MVLTCIDQYWPTQSHFTVPFQSHNQYFDHSRAPLTVEKNMAGLLWLEVLTPAWRNGTPCCHSARLRNIYRRIIWRKSRKSCPKTSPVFVCMCICMYVCMCVCVYVCMCVCVCVAILCGYVWMVCCTQTHNYIHIYIYSQELFSNITGTCILHSRVSFDLLSFPSVSFGFLWFYIIRVCVPKRHVFQDPVVLQSSYLPQLDLL